MNLNTVYDIAERPYNWLFPAIGLCSILIFILLSIKIRKIIKPLNPLEEKKEFERFFFNFNHPYVKNIYRRLPITFTVIISIATIFIVYGSLNYFIQFSRIYDNDAYSIVEGEVVIIDTISYDTSKIKKFKINNATFNTSDINSLNLAFWKPGMIKEYLIDGQYMKIYYYGKYILRVDVPD